MAKAKTRLSRVVFHVKLSLDSYFMSSVSLPVLHRPPLLNYILLYQCMCVFICCRIKGPKDTHQFFVGSAKRRPSFCGTQCRGKYGRERCSCFLLWVSEFHKVDYHFLCISVNFIFQLYFSCVNTVHVFSVK